MNKKGLCSLINTDINNMNENVLVWATSATPICFTLLNMVTSHLQGAKSLVWLLFY